METRRETQVTGPLIVRTHRLRPGDFVTRYGKFGTILRRRRHNDRYHEIDWLLTFANGSLIEENVMYRYDDEWKLLGRMW